MCTTPIDPTDDGVPTIELRELEDPALRVLRALQLALLKHPVAGQAAFNALLAEGRAFAATEAGRVLKQRLEHSVLLQRARLVFDLTTLSMLEENPPDVMPSTYVDVLFMLGSSDRSDEILDRLFRKEPTRERD
jgi:hypothetical protein